jgi:RNA-directed DNA polymerase
VYRKTIGKRVAAKLKEIRQNLRERLHEKTKDIGESLGSVVRGYFGYHAVPCNEYRLKAFRHEVLRMWWWQLRRRSQRSRWSWERFRERLGHLIPEVEIHHPYPEVRFASKHSKHPR